MQTIAVARRAMATRFEIVLNGADPVRLRAAGEEALEEIDRLENLLSLYRPASEIARVNARAAREPVRVTPELFALLQQCARLHSETAGLFDITIGPLVRCWGFMGAQGRVPAPEDLEAARAVTGMHLVGLDPAEFTVRFARPGVMLDLGAVGKGYALDRAADILRGAGVDSALLHGGTSTVCAIGLPLEGSSWKVAVENPTPGAPADPALLTTVSLRDESLSVSAVRGKSFQSDNQTFGHVLDPRDGQPARGSVLAAVVTTSATESDALSTALLTGGTDTHDAIAKLRPGMGTLLATASGTPVGIHVGTRGKIPCNQP